VNVHWHIRLADSSSVQPWDLDDGPPPVELLRPVRQTRSTALSRHIPAQAWSHIAGAHLSVESGLEHDLIRVLDRQPSTRTLVTQPIVLTWPGTGRGRSHTPDVLSCKAGGAITLWDVRPADKQDEKFLAAADVTKRACARAGWAYRIFTGLEPVERLNLLWLHRFRHAPDWLPDVAPGIVDDLERQGPMLLGQLFDRDNGDGRLIAAVWHLLWTADLHVDLATKITRASLITAPAIGGE